MDAVIRWLQTHNPKTIMIPAKKTQAGAKPPPCLRTTRPYDIAGRVPVNCPPLERTRCGLNWAKPRFPGTGTTQTVHVYERDI